MFKLQLLFYVGLVFFISLTNAQTECISQRCTSGLATLTCGNTVFLPSACRSSTYGSILHMTEDYKSTIVNAHYNRRHNLANLVMWDNELSNTATMEVAQCVKDHGKCATTQYSGQNVAWMYFTGSASPNFKGAFALAINAWYEEIKKTALVPNANAMTADGNIRIGCAGATYTIPTTQTDQGFVFACNYLASRCSSDELNAHCWSKWLEGEGADYTMLMKRRQPLTGTYSYYKVEALPNSYAAMGEGPHWHSEMQSLFYVDLNDAHLLRYSYAENKVYKCTIPGEEFAGFVIAVADRPNYFVVGSAVNVNLVYWDGISTICKLEETLYTVMAASDPRTPEVRFNDGKCNAEGTLFAGTMRYVGDELQERWGELYKFKGRNNMALLKSDVGISNGLDWDYARNKFYFIDSADYNVLQYDYNQAGESIANPNVIYNLRKPDPKNNLMPDGMTIDTEGNIYVAAFNGHTVFKVDPRTGLVLLEIKLPCRQVTSCAFGGPNLDILYVTTSSRGGELDPAGRVFQITGLGAQGYPSNKFKL